MPVLKIKSPGTILKLWNKLAKRHETGKDPSAMNVKGQQQKAKIRKGLTTLKFQAAADLTQPTHRNHFLRVRDRVAAVMRKYCRYLKSAKDEDKKALPKYLKNVKQLTVVVSLLDPGELDLIEVDAGLESLDGVDTTALDQALEKPETDDEAVEGEDDFAPGDAPPVGEKDGTPPPPPPPPPSPALAELWQKRSKEIQPRLLQALKERRGDTSKMRAVFEFALEKARGRDFAKALAGLDALYKLLGTAAAPDGQAPQTVSRPAAKVGARVAFAQLRLAWEAARKKAAAELQRLEKDVLELFRDDPHLAQIGQKIRKLDAVLAGFNENLEDRLDAACNAADADKPAHQQEALGVVARYRTYVETDAFLADISTNPVTPIAAKTVLSETLALLAKKLAG